MIAYSTSISGTVQMGEVRSQKLGVTAESWDHLSTILQDSLYTDKILAPIREYSTNAMDAHVEAGKPLEPIVVKLPNRFMPTFAVRDFGPGMDEHRVWDVFCNYGSSTKRNTNSQVGMLGIGSKSAFAYPNTTSFTVVSFQNGTKKSYVCHKGGCSAGELVQLAEETTTEPDGLEIQIPVHVEDIQQFISTAAKFFMHWEVMPKFEGNQITIKPIEKSLEFSEWYIFDEKENYNYYSGGDNYLLMGNICYQLPSDFSSYRFGTSFGFSNADVSKIEKAFSLGRIVIKAPIGSVEIAANRETLQLKEKTIRFIGERLIKIYEDIESHFNKMYDSFTKDYERRLFSSNFNYYAKYHKFHKLRGKFSNVSSSYQISEFVGADKPISSIRTYQKSRRGNRRVRGSSGYAYELPLGDNILHLVCYGKDTITDTSLLKRITPLIELEKIVLERYTKLFIYCLLKIRQNLTSFVLNKNMTIQF